MLRHFHAAIAFAIYASYTILMRYHAARRSFIRSECVLFSACRAGAEADRLPLPCRNLLGLRQPYRKFLSVASHSESYVSVPAGLFGYQLLADSRFNKGTAFSEEERDSFGLHGLLPPRVASIDEQVSRRLAAFREFATRSRALRLPARPAGHQRDAVLRAARANLEELLPIVYTPTVGAGCRSSAACFASRAACS